MANFTFILRACPDAAKPAIAQLLGRAFSLKESTCASIADSAPIVLLPDMTREEAAVMHLALAGFTRVGAIVEFAAFPPEELPKIDWPRRPQVFKRDIVDHVADCQMMVVLPGGGSCSLLSLLLNAMPGANATGAQIEVSPPVSAPPAATQGSTAPVASPAVASPPVAVPRGNEFRGIQLPEITPFGGVPTLPTSAMPASRPPTTSAQRPAAPMAHSPSNDDTLSRLNELFPEEESSGFIPNNQDITSILNKLLPDEESGNGGSSGALTAAGSGRRAAVGSGGHPVQGWAVFLAKIADEGRRQKALPLIIEMAKITQEEAEILSKKVIIPVLKGASQADAEAAKQKFAKIGILARVKGPE